MQTSISSRIGFWLFLPVSALQGLWLRLKATRLQEAPGNRTGRTGHGENLHLLALGDSIIAGVGTGNMCLSLPVQFAQALADERSCRVHWKIDGKNGADIEQLRQRIDHLDAGEKADLILISIGVNDVTGLRSTRNWRRQFKALVAELKAKWPRATVLFTGVPPMGKFPLPPQPLRFMLGQRAATLDLIAASVISEQAHMLHNPTDIDPLQQEFSEDGYHPSASACATWAKALVQRLEAANLRNL